MFQQHVTNTRLHTIMSSAGTETPHRLLPFERLKELKCFLPWTKPHHSFSAHQSRSGQTTPFLIPALRPGSHGARNCPLVLRAGGWCMMGVVGKQKGRERGVCPRGRGSGITLFHSRSSVSVQSYRRLWTGFPDALTLQQDHPVSLLAPADFPWCCAK